MGTLFWLEFICCEGISYIHFLVFIIDFFGTPCKGTSHEKNRQRIEYNLKDIFEFIISKILRRPELRAFHYFVLGHRFLSVGTFRLENNQKKEKDLPLESVFWKWVAVRNSISVMESWLGVTKMGLASWKRWNLISVG